ncbi:MAG: hypothetical protein H6736_14925 [Alphaproteobacteria bacterium]|nr:hypothetical protein [Alphaproteobacteria bacterium]MCB9693101.1 hypothetical protein [Alphaproteobacteria bacterium]
MQFDYKRVAVLTVLALLPVSALAAAAAAGADGGFCADLFGAWFGGCGGCPGK